MAQGYVHASERMWQMEVWRHISAGRLAEMFGASQLDTDKFIRTLGWRIAAQRDLDAVAPEARAVLDAYTEGVNAWLDGHRGSLGLAFLAAGVTPEPWTDLDTVAWGKVQAWNLGGNFDSEVFRYLADAQLGDPARTDELFPRLSRGRPGHHADRPARIRRRRGTCTGRGDGSGVDRDQRPTATPRPIGPAEAAAWRSIAGLGQGLLQTAGLDAADGLASDHGIGSNDWVVGPGMSQTGGALLANDPHLGISMPSIWFINGLHCRTVSDACPYDVAGVSFPACPASSSATTRASRGARPTSTPTSRTSSSRRSIRRTRTPTSTMGRPPRSTSATSRSRWPARSRSTSRSDRRCTARSSTTSTSD